MHLWGIPPVLGTPCRRPVLLAAAILLLTLASPVGAEPVRVAAPGGQILLELTCAGGGLGGFAWEAVVTETGGVQHAFSLPAGEAFFVTDAGRVIVIEDPESFHPVARVRVLDLEGRELRAWEVPVLSDPRLASDGLGLVWRQRGGTTLLDAETLTLTEHPVFEHHAAGPGGLLAGVTAGRLAVYRAGVQLLDLALDGLQHVRSLEIARDGAAAWLTDARALYRIDLVPGARPVFCRRAAGPSRPRTPDLPPRPAGVRGIPWPLQPDAQHEVGNTYGEYQAYGGAPYCHPGVDVMGSGGQPVYAVHSGVVKAILTTSGSWHWRVAIADSATSGTSSGYLYAHLDEPTIAVNVGQTVVQGQYLGDLVEWPVAEFHHCHFARIQAAGSVWYGDWLCNGNPHIDFTHQSETEPPVFEAAHGGRLLAFCENESSNYLDPAALQGQVDIIAHVGDRIAGDWVCTVQELRYTIYPLGQPQAPVVDDRQSVWFDMDLDTYTGGPFDPFLVTLLYKDDGVCDTRGDYDAREFYHVLTNSDGDQVYEPADAWEAWDTTTGPNGAYVVRVTAVDAAGNVAVDSLTVTVANPFSGVPVAAALPAGLRAWPNPARGPATIAFELAAPGAVSLTIHDVTGRQVARPLVGRLAAGTHQAVWDGRPAAGGVYFYRLETPGGASGGELILVP